MGSGPTTFGPMLRHGDKEQNDDVREAFEKEGDVTMSNASS